MTWESYLQSVCKRGAMRKLSCKPAASQHIAEIMTLATGDDRSYECEALGRKMATMSSEEQDGGLAIRVGRETLSTNQ